MRKVRQIEEGAMSARTYSMGPCLHPLAGACMKGKGEEVKGAREDNRGYAKPAA